MLFGLRTKLNFFDLDHRLLLFSKLFLFLFLILELAIINDLADGRLRIRRNLHEIQALFFSHLQSFIGRHNSYLIAFFINQADLRHSNSLIQPMFVFILVGDGCSWKSWTWKRWPGRAR